MFAYNGCMTVLHMQNTWVKLDEPSMYRHGFGTLETKRSNVSHIVSVEMTPMGSLGSLLWLASARLGKERV